MKAKTISPLKDNPLRNPGQSVQEEIDKIFDEKVIMLIIAPALFIYAAAMTWWYKHTSKIPNPALLIIIAIGVSIYSVVRIYTLRNQVKKLNKREMVKKQLVSILKILELMEIEYFTILLVVSLT